MKEVGGYLDFDRLINKPYYKNAITLNSGRNALLFFLKQMNVKKIYIPKYLCNSISNMLKHQKIDFEFYSINSSFFPLINKEIKDDEVILLVNYFGQYSRFKIKRLKDKYKNVIVDNTQAFFSGNFRGIPTFYSLRKFFGLPDGAYLFMDTKESPSEYDLSSDRLKHIFGRYERGASLYFQEYQNVSKIIKELPLLKMSKITENIFGAIDYKYVLAKRNKNFKIYFEKLNKYNWLNIKKNKGPFAYPLFIERGSKLKQYLISKKIYVPTLWPNVLEENHIDSFEHHLANNLVPLPCDQRMEEEDINRVINEVISFIENERENLH